MHCTSDINKAVYWNNNRNVEHASIIERKPRLPEDG
jgi:hypothetical protein